MRILTEALANPYVWNYGDMLSRNLTTGDHISVHFRKKGWIASKNYSVKGEVRDRNDNIL